MFKITSHIPLCALFTVFTVPLQAAKDATAGNDLIDVPEEMSAWEIRMALYGWGTALNGDVVLRGNEATVDAGFDDVWENLDYAVMGAVELSNGKWSILADLFYAELSASNTRNSLHFDAGLDQFIGNFLVAYNLIDEPETRFDIYAGARVNSLSMDLEITRVGMFNNRTFSGSKSDTWVDPIVGIRFQQEWSDDFFVRTVADIGGFDVSSNLTWQALAAVGYHLNDSGSVLLGYRCIGTDYDQGDFAYDVISHGLVLGFEYTF